MRCTKSTTLFLWCSTESEREMWRSLLGPYSWADGEFGMLCTSSQFFEFCDDLRSRSDISSVIRRQVKRYVSILKRRCGGDVCLNHGLVARLERRSSR
jgi:hypothetical protein